MTIFKDRDGREWHIHYTFRNAKTIRQKTGVNILANAITPVMEDLFLLPAILYYACEAENEMTLTEFEDKFVDLDVIDDGFDAFVAGIAFFTPSRRDSILQSLRELKEQWRKMTETAGVTLENSSESLDSAPVTMTSPTEN